MRLVLPSGRDLWLAYGMNVHPGGSAQTTEAAILSTVLPLRDRLDVAGPMGIAVRWGADGVAELSEDQDAREILRGLFLAADLVPFTGNAFVVGDFHGPGAKAGVYRPTWADPARAAYTVAFAEVLASLAPAGTDLSLSTAPGSFKGFREGPGFDEAAALQIAGTARALADLAARTGVRVRLALEPEPLCTIETTREAVDFFQGPLSRALAGSAAAADHVGVCWDVCHQAVQGEDPDESLGALARAGVAVVKVQASCALVLPDPADAEGRAALARFDEPRWLHQVATGSAGPGMLEAADLPEALAGPEARRWETSGSPWRVHFHVPVHREEVVPPLRTTRDVLEKALRALVRRGTCSHLEIETYTWEGLPPEVRAGGLVESLAREYEWVLGILESEGVRRAPEPAGE